MRKKFLIFFIILTFFFISSYNPRSSKNIFIKLFKIKNIEIKNNKILSKDDIDAKEVHLEPSSISGVLQDAPSWVPFDIRSSPGCSSAKVAVTSCRTSDSRIMLQVLTWFLNLSLTNSKVPEKKLLYQILY